MIAIATMWILPKMISWRRGLERKAVESRTTVSVALGMLSQEGQVRRSGSTEGNRMLALAPLLLSGQSSAAASATLEGIVSQAAAESNVQLGALELRPDSGSHSTFATITLKGSANGDIAGVSQMLRKLENGPTLIAIRGLSITQSDPNAGPDHMEVLHMELVLTGLTLTAVTKHHQ